MPIQSQLTHCNYALRLRIVAVLLLLLSTSPLYSSPLEDYHTTIRALKQFKGNFTQQTFDVDGREVSVQSGRFALQQPNRLHWQTIAPWPQLLVTNGQQLWLYDPDLEQVTKRQVTAASFEQTPALLLFGDIEAIDSIYQVQSNIDRATQTYEFELRDDAQSSGQSIEQLSLKISDQLPIEIAFTDKLGQLTIIEFNAIDTTANIEASLFDWQIPQGVEVFEQ